MDRTPVHRSRTLVIGSGLAGLYYALQVADRGPVTVLTKALPESSNTQWAQGGISAVFHMDDTFEAHVADTLKVGAGLCHVDMVERTVARAPGIVRDLADSYGVRFDREQGGTEFALGREGGHSHRRVVHHHDMTGAELVRALVAAAEAHPNITVLAHQMVVDLLSWTKVDGTRGCFGAYALDTRTQTVSAHVAGVTVPG